MEIQDRAAAGERLRYYIAGVLGERGQTLKVAQLARAADVQRQTVHRWFSGGSSVAHLSEPAGTTDLTISLTRRSAGGAETSIITTTLTIPSPTHNVLANTADLALLAGREPGTYVLRIIREGTVLAEGTFTLV